ncbi:MAG: hypothetical protein CMO80_01640 [Verrucomicrobiales bacterium]|nr:hypothetical protein [Verrucomicrobiales bacterium]
MLCWQNNLSGVLAVIVASFAGCISVSAVDFVRDIKPVFSDTCFKCHGPDGKAREAKLRFDRREHVVGESAPDGLIVPGQPDQSELIKRLSASDPGDRMPPPETGLKVDAEAIAKIRQWITEGAKWPEDDRHWAFVPPESPEVPAINLRTARFNQIDHFVQAKLQEKGLNPSAQANRATWLRRVSYDLTGLPPTVDELEEFLEDVSANAFENVVDRLLKSERYGEHMGLSWLEAARYADTDGYQNDRLRYQWVWRDWVFRALNDNMPFDQFTLEQLAGDMLPNRNFYTQVASGFNRNHRINSEGGSIPDEWIVEYVADRVETVGTVYLGLTFNCSRCHDHKYDPIKQKEFYQMFAFFNNVDEAGLGPNNGNSPPFIKVPKSWPQLSDAETNYIEPTKPKVRIQQTSVPRPQPGKPDTVMVMSELAKPRETYILNRGLYNQPDKSQQLRPETPESLGILPESVPRNRIGLAKWLLDPKNPLVARVTVNRFWQHFFGRGLVRTSENFGIQGELPSHPELLDWLALKFIDIDWDMKAFQRMIVLSATYRQASEASRKMIQRDPENVLLTRGPRKRLTPYQIRDTALFTSGLLVEKIGGPSVKPYMPAGLWKSISNRKYDQGKGDDLYRRSIYTYWMRTIPPPTMMVFNAAEREVCSVRKELTTTPLQALTMMNNITFVESARFIAERVVREGGENAGQRLDYLCQLLLARKPTRPERIQLMQDYKSHISEFRKDRKAAAALLAIGSRKRDAKLVANEVAAWTMLANTILNLDESITTN